MIYRIINRKTKKDEYVESRKRPNLDKVDFRVIRMREGVGTNLRVFRHHSPSQPPTLEIAKWFESPDKYGNLRFDKIMITSRYGGRA